jgi:predicted translin family RNA/ssDNA-binding protein
MKRDHAIANMRKLMDAQHLITIALQRSYEKKIDEAKKFLESAQKEIGFVKEALDGMSEDITAADTMLKMLYDDTMQTHAGATLRIDANERTMKALASS